MHLHCLGLTSDLAARLDSLFVQFSGAGQLLVAASKVDTLGHARAVQVRPHLLLLMLQTMLLSLIVDLWQTGEAALETTWDVTRARSVHANRRRRLTKLNMAS